ncbi:retrovirus-related pol polyprotein LINE-1, partial [Tanacetum coccineum]
GDLNGHIGAATDGYPGVHGGFGFGVRNEEGCSILDFSMTHDLVVVNLYFKKRDHYLITFLSWGHCTQIDYLLVRRGKFKACKDYKVFPVEACSSQHRLLSGQRMREGSVVPSILWKNLTGDAKEAFRSRVAEGVSTQVEVISSSDANSMWNILASIIKDATKDTLGVAIRTSKTHTSRKKSWWLGGEVQSKVAVKQARFRELFSC